MPSNIEEAFGNTHFLPKTYQDIKAHCDCPDDATPCKHIAGVYFRTANILDSNPMLLFQFRGLTPTELHDRLGIIHNRSRHNRYSGFIDQKQGDYPEFWARSNSFIGAMEDIYSTIKKQNKHSLK